MAHILIVDSDPAAAERLTGRLLDAGYACGWVASGDKAVTLLRWRRPDLVLLAPALKGLSSEQTLREMRQSAHGRDVAIILLGEPQDRLLERIEAAFNDAQQARRGAR